MNSILFYTENGWAFGRIHHALIKRLWEKRIYCDLLDWKIQCTHREHELLRRKYRLVCSNTLDGLIGWRWPLDRMVAVFHCERDIVLAVNQLGTAVFNDLHGFGVVNSSMIKVAADLGITRRPVVVRVGLDAEHFILPAPQSLRTVGYGGIKNFILSQGQECKRGHLVPGIVAEAGLTLREHEFYNHLAMPGYYQDIDALVVSSNYESVGLPALEAAASGRLVIGAEVGYFDGSYGIKCAIDDQGFRHDAIKALRHYAANPLEFRLACVRHRDAVRDRHDWSKCIDDWVALFD